MFWAGEIARIPALGIDVREAFGVLAGQFFTSAWTATGPSRDGAGKRRTFNTGWTAWRAFVQSPEFQNRVAGIIAAGGVN